MVIDAVAVLAAAGLTLLLPRRARAADTVDAGRSRPPRRHRSTAPGRFTAAAPAGTPGIRPG